MRWFRNVRVTVTYWCHVVCQDCVATCKLIGKWRGLIAGAALSFLAWPIHWVIYQYWPACGIAEPTSKLWTIVIYPQAGFGILAVLGFLWNLLYLPARLERDRVAEIDRLQSELLARRDDLEDASRDDSEDKLRLEYDRKKHFIEHPSGAVEVRLVVWNDDKVLAKRVHVKLASLELMDGPREAEAYARQFTAAPLQVIRQQPGFSIQCREPVEVKVIRGEKKASFFSVDGYDENGEPGTFCVPAAKYRLTVIATAHDGQHGTRKYIVWQDDNGILAFKTAPRRC